MKIIKGFLMDQNQNSDLFQNIKLKRIMIKEVQVCKELDERFEKLISDEKYVDQKDQNLKIIKYFRDIIEDLD